MEPLGEKRFLTLHVDLEDVEESRPAMQEKQGIQLSDIELELNRLWGQMDGAGNIRACLFNLIVFSQERCRTDYFDMLVKQVTQQYPCRIINIKANAESDQDYLHSHVSVERIGDGNQKIACDQITIEVSKSQLSRVPFIVLPHIIPDLPVYLMWGQDPTMENQILPHLERFATRVVFDPECTRDLHRFSREIQSQLGKSGAEILDLNWARVSAWRELLANAHDSEVDVKRLHQCSQIDIVYNNIASAQTGHCDLQALYLQAWLAAQLKWRYVSREEVEGRTIIHYDGVDVTLMGHHIPDLPPGGLLQVDIHSGDGFHSQFQRQEASRQVRVQRSSQSYCELPYTVLLSRLNRQHSLMREVFYEHTGEHYHHMLEALTKVWQS